MNDLRTPIGGFFAIIGLIVVGVGLTSRNRTPLDTTNVNLYAGIAMLVFGGLMLWLARRRS
jgi:putative Ca2+/H+ antiporter (TMEM165/GDT1 family)